MTEFSILDLRPSEQKLVALLVMEAVKDLVKVDDREILRRLSKARVVALPSPNKAVIPTPDDSREALELELAEIGKRLGGERSNNPELPGFGPATSMEV